jgi:tetratricopeptide (TPR) repeat protein
MYFRRDRYVVSDDVLANNRKLFSTSVEIGDKQMVGTAHFELGFTLLWHGDYGEAESKLRKGLELSEQCSDLYTQTLCLTYLSILCRLLGRIEEGRAYISRCLDAASERQMINYVAAARGNQAWLYWQEGDLDKAESEGNTALELWGQVPFVYPFHWTALWPLIAIAVERNQLDKAAQYAYALLKPDQQHLSEDLTVTLESAMNAVRDNQLEIARQGFRKALELAQEIGYL